MDGIGPSGPDGGMNMLVPVLLFLVGFALLIKGGDWFVDGAVGVARRFHLPELLIGATVAGGDGLLPGRAGT